MSIKKELIRFGREHLSTILSGCAVGGVLLVAAYSGQASVKAKECLAQAYEKKNQRVYEMNMDNPNPVAEPEDLTKWEELQAVWKCYVPVAVTMGATISFIIASNVVSLRKQAAIMSAAALTEASLREFKTKTKELLGEKEAEKVEAAIQEEHANKALVSLHPGGDFLRGAGGTTPCVDALIGRRFTSDIETLRRAANTINARLINGEFGQSLNDFYYEIGLDPVRFGEEIGWSTSILCEPKFTSMLMSDGTPCLVLDFKEVPFVCFRD